MAIKIKQVEARKILDSRGQWTIEVALTNDSGLRSVGSAPSGKSRGSKEAVVADPDKAVSMISGDIGNILEDHKFDSQVEFDKTLLDLDGTINKQNLGGNTILALSLSYARLFAKLKGIPLFQHFAEISNSQPQSPHLWANLINGGSHAGNRLSIQEFLISPQTRDLEESIFVITHIYHNLGEMLVQRYGEESQLLGDEGGYAPMIKKNEEALGILLEVIDDASGHIAVDVGIDVAGNYADITKEWYEKVADNFPLTYIEDPFAEDDWQNFADLQHDLPNTTMVVGDDLTVTRAGLIDQAGRQRAVQGVIIKPNQVGSVSETIEAIEKAREHGLQVIVSHRSGETNDAIIADLAYGVGADGFKLGAPARGERVAKYNRLLAIKR